MPGVPREMTRMWETEVEPTLIRGAVLRSRTLKLLGIGESAVEEALDDVVRSTAPTVATYAKSDGVHIRLTDKGASAAEVDARIEAMEQVVRHRLGQHVWGTDQQTLGGVIGDALGARGWHLATAEALSAGDVARAIADARIGDRYRGGFVRPGLDAAALEAAIAPLGAEVTLLVPAGENEVSLAVRTPDRPRALSIHFGSPEEGRRRAALGALDLLRRALG
jgi:nicotinamide-nucleotide amidase